MPAALVVLTYVDIAALLVVVVLYVMSVLRCAAYA